ncbi:hypothetical protein [Legionella nautarum]|nr:hypothetical protein [Legionella nautarum]
MNNFVNEVIECQQLDQEDSTIAHEQFSIPTDIVIDGIDLVATVQTAA